MNDETNPNAAEVKTKRAKKGEGKGPKRVGVTMRPVSTSIGDKCKNIAQAFGEKESLILAAGVAVLASLTDEQQVQVISQAKLAHIRQVKAEQEAKKAELATAPVAAPDSAPVS